MKKKKRIIIFLLFILIVIIYKSITNPLRQITFYVEKNKEALNEFSEAYFAGETQEEKFGDIEVNGIFGTDPEILQFFYSGKGIVPASVYYGFYYSPTDTPTTFQGYNYALTEVDDNEWEWEAGGDNGGRIKKLDTCWYYYEAWF